MAAHSTSDVAVVMVPYPEYGHLAPLLRLSRLISSYDIPVYYATYGARIQELKVQLRDWKLDQQFLNIHFHDLCVDDDCDFADPKCMILLNEPILALCRELISSTCKRLVIIHDTFMLPSVQLVHKELTTKVKIYMFHGFPALTLYSWIQQSIRHNDGYDGLFLPLAPYFPSIQSCCPPQFPEYIKMVSDWASQSAGEILNTSRELEGPYLDALAKLSGKPVWGLGPLNPVTIEREQEDIKNNSHACIEWLDKQPKHSVIFVSFGTSTTLAPEQINELADGLERCEYKFIWVLRSKGIRGNASATENTPKIELPAGFEERVAERGIIARDWVPQLEVLAHPSTGGYLFHSGWGSLMESVAMGVPAATWPMHSDHPFNEVAITKVLKVGIAIKDCANKDEFVTSNTIANALKSLMNSPEGEEMRQRVTELSKFIKNSWSKGGTTQKQMESFITHITT